MSSFSDYVKKHGGGAQTNNAFARYLSSSHASPVTVAAPRRKWAGVGGDGSDTKKKPAAGNTSVISDILDLLDRPRRAVDESITEGLIKSADRKVSNPFDVWGAMAHGFGDGLTGNDHKEGAGEDIERITDAYGKNDPHYKNTKDNVNPILKGIGGFAGDVLTDPLTFVPLPVGKGVGAVAKLLGKGAEDAGHVGELAKLVEKEPALVKAEPVSVKPASPVAEVASPVDAGKAEPTPGIATPTVEATDPMEATKLPDFSREDRARLTKLEHLYDQGDNRNDIGQLSKSELAKYKRQMDAWGEEIDSLRAKRDAAKPVKIAPVKPVEAPLSEQVVADVANTMRTRIGKDLKPDPAEYKYTTADGAKSTAEGIGVGKSVVPGIYENGKQSELLADFNKAADKDPELKAFVKPDGKVLNNPARAVTKMGQVLARLGLHDKMLGHLGIPQHMVWRNGETVGKSTETAEAFLSQHEVLSAMAKVDPTLTAQLFFRPGASPYARTFYSGIAKLVAGHDIEDVMLPIVSKTDEFGRAINSKAHIFQQKTVPWQVYPNAAAVPKGIPKALIKPTAGGAFLVHKPVATVARDLANVLEQIRPHLQELSAQNAVAYGERVAADTTHLTQEGIGKIIADIEGPDFANTVRSVSGLDDYIASLARVDDLAPEASKAATKLIEEAAPKGAVKAGKTRARAAGAKDPKPATEQGMKDAGKLADEDTSEVLDGIESGELDPAAVQNWVPIDMSADYKSAQAARGIAAGTISHTLDTVKSMFDQTHLLGKLSMWNVHHDAVALRKLVDAKRREDLLKVWNMGKQLGEDGKTTLFDQAFYDLQHGKEATTPLHTEIQRVLSTILPTGVDKTLLSSPAFLHGDVWKYMNSQMKKFDGLKGIELDEQAIQAAATRGLGFKNIAEAMADQWHGWSIDDPKQFLLDFQRLTTKMAVDHATANELVNRMTAAGLAGVEGVHKIPGHFRGITASGESTFAAFLPKGLKVDPEVGWGLQRMDQMLRESTSLKSPFGQFIQTVVDPVQQAWKRAMTVLRPGHHIRNGVGDFSQTFLAEGVAYARKSSVDAFKLMQLKKEYDSVDLIGAISHLGETTLKPGEILSTGKFGELSGPTLVAALHERGLWPDAKVIDDLALSQDDASKWARTMNKLSFNAEGSKIGHVAHTLTEVRDHYQRAQHFMQIIRKAQKSGVIDMGFKGKIKPRDLNHLFELASEKVIRAHPDASLLTGFEYKYLRRLIPFYSWMRGALPFVAAHSLQYPGRVTAINKASFNLALGMGVHPDSLDNPFPDDQLFPSFLTEQMQGPQFRTADGYFSLSPGLTTWDVSKTFLGNGEETPLANVASGVASMINPALKAPAELFTGHRLVSGSPIHDASDYVDGQLPGANYFSQATGISPTGSLVSLLQRGKLDSTYNAAKGTSNGTIAAALGANNPNVDNPDYVSAPGSIGTSFFNWLTGGGLTNQSQSSYINLAEIEKRNRTQKALKAQRDQAQ